MKKILAILFFLTPILSLFAQQNLSDGYIITNSNDTIHGQIDLRTSTINQQRCTFVDASNNSKIYLPGEIKGYRYINEGKFYISKTITVDNSEQLIFAEYLVQGGLSLFYFEKDGLAYFIFEEEGKEHFYITKHPPVEVDRKMKEDTKYVGMLKYYFRDSSPTMMKLIEKSKFYQRSMIKIAKQYNDENCLNPGQNSCIIFENDNPDKFGLQFKFSVYTGIQNTTYSGHLFDASSTFPLLGGQVYINNPRWSKSFGFVVDLSFSKMKKESQKLKSPITSSYNILKYDMYDMSVKLGLRYTYSKYRLRPSIEGGLSSAYIIKNNSTWASASNSTIINRQDYDVRKFHIGWYVGMGVEYNIIKDQFIFLRFNYDKFSETDYMQTSGTDHISLWQLKLGYTF
ncbi:outer membrane beta-barrel protein [Dysgonomonas massiliensis]|uniref:outer membrane beta-barrel protein n=1 Tax=Dysgonomonas massiliensis TaxID=2040292 RepID=UPI000C789AD7|nr:outer membrane beta-barrel protein [Dysgonomonas massiliensis]